MTRVIIDDLRTAGVGTCPKARKWFDRNGLHWRDFAKQGLDAEVLLAKTEDGAREVALVVKAAEEREAREQEATENGRQKPRNNGRV